MAEAILAYWVAQILGPRMHGSAWGRSVSIYPSQSSILFMFWAWLYWAKNCRDRLHLNLLQGTISTWFELHWQIDCYIAHRTKTNKLWNLNKVVNQIWKENKILFLQHAFIVQMFPCIFCDFYIFNSTQGFGMKIKSKH